MNKKPAKIFFAGFLIYVALHHQRLTMTQPTNFLRKALGLNKDEVWREFAASIGAEFIPSDFWLEDKSVIRLQVNSSFIGMYISSDEDSAMTRAVSSFLDKSCFSFLIRRKSVWNLLGSSSALGDAELAAMLVEKGLRIKTNDVDKAQFLLSDRAILENIQAVFMPGTEMKIECQNWDESGGLYKHEIVFEHFGVMKDTKRLNAVFDLVSLILVNLEKLREQREKI